MVGFSRNQESRHKKPYICYQKLLSVDSNFPAVSFYILPHLLFVPVSVSGLVFHWLTVLMTHQRERRRGQQENKTSALALLRLRQTILFPTELSLNGYLSTTWLRHHPSQLQPAAMCKGLASLPTCCLERYIQLHA